MAKQIKIASKDEIPLGTMKSFKVGEKIIMICNVDNSYFALDDICTHEYCSLSGEGFLDADKIICGCHGAQFNAQDGKVLSPPAPTNLNTYKTTVTGSDIYIEI